MKIAKRRDNKGSLSHPRKLSVRMTVGVSQRLMSLQGLVRKYGRKDMVWLWENICMPAIAAYAKPLAEMARKERKATA